MSINLKTTTDRDLVLDGIDTLTDILYQSNKDPKKELTPFAYQSIYQAIKGRITQAELILLRNKLLNLPVISLTLAYIPEETIIEKITHWLRNNFDEPLIINFNTDPSILGGAQISYNGKYRDESLRKKIEEVFNN